MVNVKIEVTDAFNVNNPISLGFYSGIGNSELTAFIDAVVKSGFNPERGYIFKITSLDHI